MNSRRATLLLLAINLGLLGALVYMVRSPRNAPATEILESQAAIAANTITQISVRKINSTNNLFAALAGRPLSWRSLESTNYYQFIQNLRAFDCPEETIRDIIITDVAKLYGRRRSEMRAEYPAPKFWQSFDPLGGSTEPVELQRRLRQLEKEQRLLIRELLGVDLQLELARYSGDADAIERSYSFLPSAKQAQVRALAGQFDELEQDLYVRARGWLLDGDQEELRQLQRQRREQMAALLDPQELEEYELRFSETSNNLRSQMIGFQPNEEEFRRIFRLQQTFDQEYNQAFDLRDESAQAAKAGARDQAEEALTAEIQKSLGPERYAEYQRAQDTDYRNLLQLGERLDLPADVANKIYSMKMAAERVKLQVDSNPNLSEEQRARLMADLARTTSREVQRTMGKMGFQTYQENGGQWLPSLSIPDENALPPQPQLQGTVLPYDINQLPPDIQQFFLNPNLFIRPEFRRN